MTAVVEINECNRCPHLHKEIGFEKQLFFCAALGVSSGRYITHARAGVNDNPIEIPYWCINRKENK